LNKFDEMQLRFDLPELDDAAEDAQEGAISYEEARRRSEAARLAFEHLQLETRLGGEVRSPGWFGDYLKLIEQGWPWRVACYIAWAASPKIGRWPATIKELAESVLGLASTRVIYVWRRKYATIDQVVAMMQAAPLWEHRRDVLDALVEMARSPDYKAFNDRKLFLEMTGDYVPRSKLDIGKSAAGDEQEMSDEELRRISGQGSVNSEQNNPSDVTSDEDLKDAE